MNALPERVAIFIDGGNFYRQLRASNLPKGKRLNYPSLIEHLLRGRTLVSKTYYIGIVRNFDHSDKSQSMVQDQQKFLSRLQAEGFTIKCGRIVYDHKIREKGVDVQIAIDMVTGAADDQYDSAVIVSSDTDLLPAVRYVKERRKTVEYVGFSRQPSLGMTRESSLTVLLLPDDLARMTVAEDVQKAA